MEGGKSGRTMTSCPYTKRGGHGPWQALVGCHSIREEFDPSILSDPK